MTEHERPHLVYGFDGRHVLCECREGGWMTRGEFADHCIHILTARTAALAAEIADLRARVEAVAALRDEWAEYGANGTEAFPDEPPVMLWTAAASHLTAALASAPEGDRHVCPECGEPVGGPHSGLPYWVERVTLQRHHDPCPARVIPPDSDSGR